MKYCNDKECSMYACCHYCIHSNVDSNFEYTCKLEGIEIEPFDLCPDFDCYRNYEHKKKEEK